jgi:4,4'-diaponeurosporenoate glycosyltransferase
MLASIALMIIGIICILILFKSIRKLNRVENLRSDELISIIIPMRNEEKNIENLLNSLVMQSYKNIQIICVDDNSSDKTYELARKYPVEVYKTKEKPEDWIGKSWACLFGVEKAKGDIFIFMDADVSVDYNTVESLMNEYLTDKKTISVMPYHETKRFYEQFSFFFNYIQFAANGMGFNNDYYYLGLYGPIILIHKDDYKSIGTHEAVKNSLIEDVDLGINLHKKGLGFKLFMGDEGIKYRMYPNGFNALVQGWCKNQASAAIKTKILILVLVASMIGLYIKIPVVLFKAVILTNIKEIIVYTIMYAILVLTLLKTSKNLGNFKGYVYLFYPIYLIFYMYIFLCSLIKKILRIPIKWKGRIININAK